MLRGFGHYDRCSFAQIVDKVTQETVVLALSRAFVKGTLVSLFLIFFGPIEVKHFYLLRLFY